MDETVSVTTAGPTARPIVLCLAQQRRLDPWACRLEKLRTFILLQADDFLAAAEMVPRCRPDLIVTDQIGAQSIPADFRERFLGSPMSRLPVALLRDQDDVAQVCLVTGANIDAVLPADLNAEQTAIRLRAVLRRKRPMALVSRLRWGPLELRHDERSVLIDGRPVHLSPREFNFLALLLEAPGRVWSREELQDAVWGPDVQVTTQAVNIVAQRLRRHLVARLGHELIKVVRGDGYRLA